MSLLMVRKVSAADAGNFKVGDHVLRKGYPAPSPRDYYKVIAVHPNGSVMLDDGFNGYYSQNLIIRAADAADSAAQDADIREPKVGDVLKYYHPRTGKYVGKVKVVNIHRHSSAKWDAQFECEYLDGELKGGRFRDEGGENISFT